MSKKPKRRPYRKQRRAEAEEETRQRITVAAVELHGTVGPANTKVTDLAERAGVSRMTVYNHFPSDADLFRACSSHWARENPYPVPAQWLRHPDARVRLRTALVELYEWYGQKQGMMGKILRDAPLVPALGAFMEESWGGYVAEMVDTLSLGWTVADGAREGELRASLRLAVDFHTWRALTESGLSDAAAAELAARLVSGAAAPA
jgi:AcrR family transcriptional regulator